jgi:hypothetical protein
VGRRFGASSGVTARQSLCWLVVVAVAGAGAGAGAGAAGCGSSRAVNGTNRVAVAEVGSTMRQMLSDLERGSYTAACEAFTLKSRYGMAITPGLDGHESGSSCSDVFIIAGTLDNLGFSAVGHTLRREAGRAGLTKDVELPGREVHKLLRGIGATPVSVVVDNLEIEGSTARYRGTVVARYEGGRWLLEAIGWTKATYAQDREGVERKCDRSVTKGDQMLCHLLRAVLAGRVLSGARHRELNHLLPLLFRPPKLPMLERAFQHSRFRSRAVSPSAGG